MIKVSHISKRYYLGQSVSLKHTLKNITQFFIKLLGFKNKISTSNPDLNEFWALKDISFDLNQGEILGIIGTNGSGKSTLLKILSRVTTPTTGSAVLNGRVSSLLEVGTGFNPELTGKENIFLNGALLGLSQSEIQNKYNQIVEFSGISKFIDTPVKRYSSGMTVRLGFSVAAHLDSEIMIIDEVLAVGDADFQKQSFARLKEIREQKRAILFVSHSMDLVASLCQRVLWLHQGEVRQIGTPQEVVQSYLQYHEQQRGMVKIAKKPTHNSPYVSEFNMFDSARNRIASAAVGQKVLFTGLISKLSVEVNSVLALNMWIENQNGLVVCEVNSNWKNQKITGKGMMEFQIEIPKILMVPGLYSMNLELSVNYQKSDRSLQFFSFFVTASDFYGSGVIAPNQGQFFTDFNMTFKLLKEEVS